MIHFSYLDWISVFWFVTVWFGFSLIVDRSPLRKYTLSNMMNKHRVRWMRSLSKRDVRIVDTAIMTGLQNGTAFFASTSLLAIGAGFALLNSTDLAIQISQDLGLPLTATPQLWEAKVLLLIVLFVYAFFKFGWAYRLFNYTSILVGAFPEAGSVDKNDMDAAIEQAGEINILAGRHFNLGLRAFFFSLATFGWFIHPIVFIFASTFIGIVLLRRQFFSRSQALAAKLVDLD